MVGLLAGSLALLADAAHNLNDTASMGIALVARKVAAREADERRTFGYERAELVGSDAGYQHGDGRAARRVHAASRRGDDGKRTAHYAPGTWDVMLYGALFLWYNVQDVFGAGSRGEQRVSAPN